MQNKEAVMGRCVELARNAKGFTLTNPLVGAAVIKNGQAVYGIHEKYGSHHAEVNAIKMLVKMLQAASFLLHLSHALPMEKRHLVLKKLFHQVLKKFI